MKRWAALLAAPLLAAAAPATAAVDLRALWDFANPVASEQRFQAALAAAQGDDALVLKTQIARTHGLRGDPQRARAVLKEMHTALEGAGDEPRVRWLLEWGRSWISATTRPEERTPEALAAARTAYLQAWERAEAAALHGLAVDAVHMLAFVDDTPADQLTWANRALAIAQASTQPEAQRWLATLRHNRGLALKALGRLDEALADFRQVMALRQQQGDARNIRIAHWTIAFTLRAQGRLGEALQIQQRLEQELDAAGQRDEYVYEELALLHRALGDSQRAEHYTQRLNATRGERR